jgi:tRNA threonylcarbamoyladenosine biosynthesis protein TsaB
MPQGVEPSKGAEPNVLALDTATPRAAIAVATSGGAIHVARPDSQERHGRNLVPAIRDLLRQAGLDVGAIDLFAAGLGPGSYTGLRVGLTAAKLLAYAAGRPLVGFDSLEAIAWNAPVDALRITVIADAQRGDLYTADFARDAPGAALVRRRPTGIESCAGWAERLALAPGTLVLGPALQRADVRSALPAQVQSPDPLDDAHWPDARRLPELARILWQHDRRDDPWFLEPLYLRRSAAEDQWERKALASPS